MARAAVWIIRIRKHKANGPKCLELYIDISDRMAGHHVSVI